MSSRTSSEETHGIATRALRSTFWSYATYVSGLAVTLLVTAVLARLLSPDEFGLVALALVAVAVMDTFPGLGVGEALIVGPDDEVEDRAETAFAVSVGVGLVLAASMAALGPIAAGFFDEPQLTEVMAVLGVTFLIHGFGLTHGALAQKRMDFRARNIAALAGAICRGVVGVPLALSGAGVWSLVLGYVAGSATITITLWLLVPWRPRLRPRRAHLRSLLSFGGTLTGVNVMAAFLTQFDYVVVARVLGAASLGYYSMATRLPHYAILGLAAVANRVLFPAIASLQPDRIARALVKTFRYAGLVIFPIATFLAVLAESVTIALFGDQWGPSVGAMRVLCVWATASVFLYVLGSVFKAQSRPDLVLKLAVPQAVGLVVGTLFVVRYGIVAVSAVQAAIALLALGASIFVAKRLSGFPPGELLGALWQPAVAAFGLGATLWAVEHTISRPWPTIIIGGALGSAVYLAMIVILARESLADMKRTAFPARTIRTPQEQSEGPFESME